jgi:hypothetical protein
VARSQFLRRRSHPAGLPKPVPLPTPASFNVGSRGCSFHLNYVNRLARFSPLAETLVSAMPEKLRRQDKSVE